MDRQTQRAVYRAMLAARRVDELERELTSRGEAFFHVSGAGHEATAALAPHLIPQDWLHCHYRDKALMLARGVSPRAFFDSLYCKRDSHSQGRQMSAHMCDPELHVLSIVGPVGNSGLQAVGVAAAVAGRPQRPIVLCSIGDGTSQQGEMLEAVSHAVREQLPVLFLIEDNRWAISTTTDSKTFYSLPEGDADSFLGLPIEYFDGRRPDRLYEQFGGLVGRMRRARGPAIVVLRVERLANHTNADDQSIYRGAEEIRRAAEAGDPLRNFEGYLRGQGWSEDQLAEVAAEAKAEVERDEAESAAGPDPAPALTAKKPLPAELTHLSHERRAAGEAKYTMRDALREVLRFQLQADPRVTLFGQDIEDPKGDVFGVTKGLSTEFGGRVSNAPLTESTILGVSIGRALAGERPVAFLQFADFLPLAYNQIVSELGSLYWRTAGAMQAPVIVMIACGGYRPGLGPFHAQTFESLAAHTPGVDVFMPSTAADAAGMLNAAFRSGRPTLFFYPKSLLNDPARAVGTDVARCFTPIGPCRKARAGRDLTLVGWGSTTKLVEMAAAALEEVEIEAEVLDLRSLSPWDEQAVLASAEKTARLIVVHEDNHTCGLGGEILATVAEKARVPVSLRRVTRPDTFVPCNFANQLEVLPSLRRVLTTAAELLDLELTWEMPETAEEGKFSVPAIGSGPSDETVQVVEFLVRAGETIERGQPIASLEATKSVFELTSPMAGEVETLLAAEGETVAVGAPLLRLRVNGGQRPRPVTEEQGRPRLKRKASTGRLLVPRVQGSRRCFEVGTTGVASVTGRRLVTNEELLARRPETNSDDIMQRTGIQSRRWAAEGETAVDMATRACWKLLEREGLLLDDIELLICSTTSPTQVTPSMACQVLHALGAGRSASLVQAYDINAACSGYLYALQAGYDFLQSRPDSRVLVVTAELLSRLVDPEDFDTAFLFGDAATATILLGEGLFEKAHARVSRPELSAKGDDGSNLSVPLLHDGFIQMRGRRVFTEAVRTMVGSLQRVCAREGLRVDDLAQIVPHQANGRIIQAVQGRVQPPVFSNIRHLGNTSSSTIPLCLEELLPAAAKGDKLGLCAFGGGFTFGAGMLERL